MAYVGLEELYYAKMITEETPTSPPVYDTPKRIVGLNAIDITPEVEKNFLYGDNKALDSNTVVKKYTLKIDTADLPMEDQAALQGHEYNSDTKVISVGSDDVAPNVALMFASNVRGNKKWLTEFYKGKFSEASKNLKTRGESAEYALHTIEGEFVYRTDNNKIFNMREIDSSDTTTENAFFASVGGGLS